MHTAKWIAALGFLAAGSVTAQDTVYDYQGAVMTGLGGPEPLTAQLQLFGRRAWPDDAFRPNCCVHFELNAGRLDRNARAH